MIGAVLDLIIGAIVAALGILALARPTTAAAVLAKPLRRLGIGAPTRAGVRGRGVLFLLIGVALVAIGISFI
jgi:hypothetical protein